MRVSEQFSVRKCEESNKIKYGTARINAGWEIRNMINEM
jgi:hypothetical protein